MEPGRVRTLLCFCHRVDGIPEESAVVHLLRSFFLGGFECSSHRRADGERLDLIASSGHEELALEDTCSSKRTGSRRRATAYAGTSSSNLPVSTTGRPSMRKHRATCAVSWLGRVSQCEFQL
jgi:hypothetical protein